MYHAQVAYKKCAEERSCGNMVSMHELLFSKNSIKRTNVSNLFKASLSKTKQFLKFHSKSLY